MVVSHHEGRQLAEDILRSQDAEISRMRQWRREWFGNDATPPMNHMPMLGNMVGHAGQTMDMAADVERLRSANGAFDIAFLDAMIPHHQSAVEAGRLARCSSQRNRRSRTWRWRSSKRNSARSISCRPGASRGARPRRRNLRARHPALTDMSARRRHELLIRPGFGQERARSRRRATTRIANECPLVHVRSMGSTIVGQSLSTRGGRDEKRYTRSMVRDSSIGAASC